MGLGYNITGYSIFEKPSGIMKSPAKAKLRPRALQAQTPLSITKKRTAGIIDIPADILTTENNDKAFLFENGNVDILKPVGVRHVKFKNKKSAALYLMRAGWKYV
jgi:hypothetical protein